MAHELQIKNGKASMFYVNEAPWHGLGTRLESPATATEAIRAANLDWEVIKKPIYLEGGQMVKDRFGLVQKHLACTTQCPVFGIVGKQYAPLQNRAAFAFFDPIVGQDAAIYHTAGALGEGERVWILAKLPSDICVIGEDVVNKFLLLSNSHDGKSSVQLKFTPIRVVCHNTLTLALREGPTLHIVHKRDMRERLRDATRLLGIIEKRFDDLGESYQRMTKVQIGGDQLKEYLESVFPDPKEPDDGQALARVCRDRVRAEYFFSQGKGTELKGVPGTLWAAYNGVTEYVDHRAPQQDANKLLESVWFGDGYLTKAKAFQVAKEKTISWG